MILFSIYVIDVICIIFFGMMFNRIMEINDCLNINDIFYLNWKVILNGKEVLVMLVLKKVLCIWSIRNMKIFIDLYKFVRIVIYYCCIIKNC